MKIAPLGSCTAWTRRGAEIVTKVNRRGTGDKAKETRKREEKGAERTEQVLLPNTLIVQTIRKPPPCTARVIYINPVSDHGARRAKLMQLQQCEAVPVYPFTTHWKPLLWYRALIADKLSCGCARSVPAHAIGTDGAQSPQPRRGNTQARTAKREFAL